MGDEISVKRVGLSAVLAILPVACSDDRPSGSYLFPTAIIGVPLQSAEEANELHAVVANFGKRRALGDVYREADMPFFREQGMGLYPDKTQYKDFSNVREGFSLQVVWWPPGCMLVQLSERSGIWTAESLAAYEDLKQELARATQSRATELVRPKASQNWPHEELDPERPTFPEELCVRMGLPDPRATKVHVVTHLTVPAAEFREDGDPTTLQIVFLDKEADGPTRVSDNGEVVFLYRAPDKASHDTQRQLMGRAFEIRARAAQEAE